MSLNLTGRAFQQALFARLGEESNLAALFSEDKGARSALPRLEFNFLRSYAEENENIFRHEFEFSLWSELYDRKRADELADKLCVWLDDAPLSMTGVHLVWLKFESMGIYKDKATRYRRHQIRFHALTEAIATQSAPIEATT